MSLSLLYQQPELPASFSGINALKRVLGKEVSTKDIIKWLSAKESYTLHKPIVHRYKRNRVFSNAINYQFQADLVDMQKLKKHNRNYKYILTCIDVFSKYAWAVPIKDKKADTVKSAFEKIFKERIPRKLQTDKGTEFTNKMFQSYLKQNNIHFFTSNNETKASIIERFHRTLKTKMWKYFTEFNTYKYIDVLDKFLDSYNNTWHRSIKMKPAEVTKNNEAEVRRNLYKKAENNCSELNKFQVGDLVRVSKLNRTFEKGYEHKWSREIFTVCEVITRIPTVYKLKDFSGEILQGCFYASELQKVIDSGYYPVEKVLKKRTTSGKKEYFVKFLGYPAKFNAWVSDIKLK